MKQIANYAMHSETKLSFEKAIENITELFKEQGFGILTEIDVKATFKKKIDVDFKPFKILGACNPTFAHQALEFEPHIGTLLPCNIVVWDEGDHRVVTVMDPRMIYSNIPDKGVKKITDEIYNRIKTALARLEQITD